MEIIKAEEARNLTDKCLSEMYNNFLEDLFNEIYDNAQSGKDFITFETKDCPWWYSKYTNDFTDTMAKLGYKIGHSGDFKKIHISW